VSASFEPEIFSKLKQQFFIEAKTTAEQNLHTESRNVTLCRTCLYRVTVHFTLDVKSVLNENLGGIPGGTQC
jgi:hypothetical protein